ncbi:LacI family DNA-binding transcriptional regulator [Pseudomonas poae]|uniref:LacI family transcriptional regulator n=1 Tax=Pseudomonas poae TaxID=200451 RepID=A0A2S9EVJ2_9PSED|nr:LacI family DNA-binding transcriptional regulator [Pseudomonas poae]PRA28736.1 LacI family transcriptional regulator [Pseudomonas poae]PRC20433.1 LacI family transcriptional regulator [Pseudomonas poae]
MTKPFTTLDDVAQAAGMSRAQVSRALRGDPGVREETRKRISDIAAQLEYRPNLAARSLVFAQSSIVGLVLGDPNNSFHIQLAQAVDRELIKAGFDPVTSLRPVEQGCELQDIERLLRLRPAGVIMIGTPHTARTISEIADKLPCVYIGSKRIPHPRVTTVAVDDESGIRQAMEHLIGLGHRAIAHLGGGREASARERAKTYFTVMEEAQLEPLFVEGSHDATFGRRGVDVLFEGDRKPTAILASNDFIALGVLDRLKGMGLSVPGDVSVVGFDDIPSAANELFSLSTLKQDTVEQARVAVGALRVLLAGTHKPSRRLLMPVELILRRSTAAPN